MSNVKYYLFNKNCYAKIDAALNSADPSKIVQRTIKDDWCELSKMPIEFSEDIDDIFHSNGVLYFLKGALYARYDIRTDRCLDPSPKNIGDDFPVLRQMGFAENFDAAVGHGNDEVYFFKNDNFVKFNLTTKKAAYDVKKIGAAWNGLSSVGFDSNLDAVCEDNNGNLYFFKGENCLGYVMSQQRVASSGVLKIAEHWEGIKRIQAACMLGHDSMCCCDHGTPGDKPVNPNCNNPCDCNGDPCDGDPCTDHPKPCEGHCGGKCGDNPQGGRQCFSLPANTKFGLNALINSDSTQTVKVFIDDKQVDTLTGSGLGNVNPGAKTYNSGSGKVCVEVWANGKMSPLRYADNPLDNKPGMVVMGTEDGKDNDYNDSIVILNWGLQ
jgi:mannose-binding lectin